MNSRKIKDDLQKGLKSPLYIFTGEEREVMKKYLSDIDPDYRIIKSVVEALPLMNSKTMLKTSLTLVIKDDKDALKFNAQDLIKAVGSNTLILIYPTIDKVCKLGKTAEAYHYEFERPKNAYLYVKGLIPVNDSQSKRIAERCNNDIRRIELEVEKLQILEALGHKITGRLIDEMIIPPAKNKIWNFIDSIVAKDDTGIWPMLKDLKELGQSEVQLAGALYSSYKQLYIVQSYRKLQDKEIIEKTGFLIWQVKKSRNLISCKAGRILEDLKKIAKFDNDLKFGRVDAELGFKNLIIELVYY